MTLLPKENIVITDEICIPKDMPQPDDFGKLEQQDALHIACNWRIPQPLTSKEVDTMNRTLFWVIVAAVLVIAFLLYDSRSGRSVDVDPHAREVIEKAKRR
jgi:hypothetical protein